MAKTKQKLAEEVLLELGRADAANPAESAEDIDLVKRRYEGVLGELEDSDLVFWDEDAIPERVFAPLAKLIASECAQAFGTVYDGRDANGKTPLQRLQAIAARDNAPWPVKAEYF
ncbi:MAG: hypothetical protein MPJ78_19630 [Hyphomicrobiaceae bacterium]|nr:hypothetical protein [Hyphomicrobiaceae bacterium]